MIWEIQMPSDILEESSVFNESLGKRLSLQRVLGEGFMAKWEHEQSFVNIKNTGKILRTIESL